VYNLAKQKSMNIILKKGAYFILLILINSCVTNKDHNNTTNTYPNSKYKKSSTTHSGTFNRIEYNELIKKLEEELKTTIPTNKSVLINYNQKASNCIQFRFSKNDNIQVIKNIISISSYLSSNYNAIDFFVYTNDSFNSEIYKQMNEFVLDSGFFYENIFTEHQNCAGFILIKPNGEFYKLYGEDYFTEVKAIFEKNKNNP
jgi:hypothetical protein